MVSIPRGKESIVGSLTSVSKQLVVILFVCLLALSIPAAMAQTSAVIEDYEDGGIGSWNSGTNVEEGVIGSGSWNFDPSGGNHAVADGFNINTTNYQATVYIKPDGEGGAFTIGDYAEDAGYIYAVSNDGVWSIRVENTNNERTSELAVANMTAGEWYELTFEGNGSHHSLDVDGLTTSESGSETVELSTSTTHGVVVWDGLYNESVGVTIDQIESSGMGHDITGKVVTQGQDPLDNVTIEAVNESGVTVDTDTTGELGDYSLSLTNGTYNVTASKQNYSSETQSVTVSGEDQTVNFQLTEFNQSITLDSRMYMEYGQEAPYDVVVSVDGDRRGVTEEANVTSGNVSVVTIDDSDHEVVATNDTSVNNRTYVQAEWTDDEGNTYTTSRNVTVANATVENIQILPDFTRFTASLSDETVMVIIIATGVGAAAALFATSFAGVSAVTMVMLLGWLAGYVNNGMAILAVLMAMFVGMNVAGNVDYTVRR